MTIRVGVLGANGQVGPVLLKCLAEARDIQAIAICRNRVGAAAITADCDIRLGSVTDQDEAGTLLRDCDVVVNCIWPLVAPKDVKPTNEALLRNLRRLPNLRRVIHLSSVAVYGCIYPSTTFSHPRPDSSYGRDKLALEKYAARLFSDARCDYFAIRLGHVFGPHQWLSRDVVDLAGSRSFRLPFDGTGLSNAIHVEDVAVALTWLVSAPVSSGVYNLAARPQRTWREVFDWHTTICGLPPVEGMPTEASLALRDNHRRRTERSTILNCFGDMFQWVRSLPVQQLIASDAVRMVGSAALRRMPVSLRERVRSRMALGVVRQEIRALEGPVRAPDPWHYSDAMPGRYLEVPPRLDPGALGEREEAIRSWYLLRSRPQWSLQGAPGGTVRSVPAELRRADHG